MNTCIACNKCCRLYRITILPEEAEIISSFLNISKEEFLRNYCEMKFINKIPFYILKKNKDKCIFLKKGKCKIYTVRPYQCKIFPNLGTKFSFCKIQKKIFTDPLVFTVLEKYRNYVILYKEKKLKPIL